MSGLPTPQSVGADDDFVVISAGEEPREGRVLISDTPVDRTSAHVASFRLPLPDAADDDDDDVVVVEAADYDDAAGRFAADIPRDRNFGVVAGPRLPLPDDDFVVVDVASDKEGRALSDIPRDISAAGQAGFRLPLTDTAAVRSLAEDDFEIVEVGDDDEDSGRSIPLSDTPTNQVGFNQAAFRLPEGNLGDFVIVEAASGREEPRVSSKDPADCLKPLTRSRCRAALVRYYYNVDTQSCQQFSFGGCDDGHSNRFESLEECQQVCITN